MTQNPPWSFWERLDLSFLDRKMMTQPPVIMYSVNSFYSFLSTRALKLRWSSSLVRTNNHWWEARAKIWRLTFSIPSLLSLSVYWQKFLLLPIKRCEWVGPSELLLTKVSTVWAEAQSHHCRRGLNIWFHSRVDSTSQKCGQFLNPLEKSWWLML